MLRGIDGEWLKMAFERRTDYKLSCIGCDGFARYSVRVLPGIAMAALSEVLSVRAGRNRSGNTVRFRLLGIFDNILGRTVFL